MTRPTDVHTLRDFTQHSTEFIQKLLASGRPRVLTVEGQPTVVVLGMVAYHRLEHLAERWEAVDQVREGLEDVEAGRHRSYGEVIRSLRERYGTGNGSIEDLAGPQP
ncbi:MAG: type II toxin-antitoxin system Phd/YefM family antitoxin [Planctomycetes bacterium]|nr:type II toxin-antitoxin system Phd/YefM family antitoxin [Planctomycetota bacterium]